MSTKTRTRTTAADLQQAATEHQAEIDTLTAQAAALDKELPAHKVAVRDALIERTREETRFRDRVCAERRLSAERCSEAMRADPKVRAATEQHTEALETLRSAEEASRRLHREIAEHRSALATLAGGSLAELAALTKEIEAAERESAELAERARQRETLSTDQDQLDNPDLLSTDARAAVLAQIELGELSEADGKATLERHQAALGRAQQRDAEREQAEMTTRGLRARSEQAAERAAELRELRDRAAAWYLAGEIDHELAHYAETALKLREAWGTISALATVLEALDAQHAAARLVREAGGLRLPRPATASLEALDLDDSPTFRAEAMEAQRARLIKSGVLAS